MKKLYNNKTISLPFLYTILLPTYCPETAGERFHSLGGDFSSSVCEGQRWGVSSMMSHLLDSGSRVGSWGPQQQAHRKEGEQGDPHEGLICVGKAVSQCEQ